MAVTEVMMVVEVTTVARKIQTLMKTLVASWMTLTLTQLT